MRGFVLKTKTYGVSILCTECMATEVSPTAVEEHMHLDTRLERTVECYNCAAEIDGEDEDPKPESFTVTVQVVIYADEDIETAQDAQDFVEQEMCHFESVEIQDVLEHF